MLGHSTVLLSFLIYTSHFGARGSKAITGRQSLYSRISDAYFLSAAGNNFHLERTG